MLIFVTLLQLFHYLEDHNKTGHGSILGGARSVTCLIKGVFNFVVAVFSLFFFEGEYSGKFYDVCIRTLIFVSDRKVFKYI